MNINEQRDNEEGMFRSYFEDWFFFGPLLFYDVDAITGGEPLKILYFLKTAKERWFGTFTKGVNRRRIQVLMIR
jgi:hypothetical protein